MRETELLLREFGGINSVLVLSNSRVSRSAMNKGVGATCSFLFKLEVVSCVGETCSFFQN